MNIFYLLTWGYPASFAFFIFILLHHITLTKIYIDNSKTLNLSGQQSHRKFPPLPEDYLPLLTCTIDLFPVCYSCSYHFLPFFLLDSHLFLPSSIILILSVLDYTYKNWHKT
jgi:hypothetical protein